MMPIDFWEEAFTRLKIIKPDLIILSVGALTEYIKKTFDICYGYITIGAYEYILLLQWCKVFQKTEKGMIQENDTKIEF